MIAGIDVQIDLGNLAVGLATAFIAIVTLIMSSRTTDQLRKQKIADLRNCWLDDLRTHLALFGADVMAISVGQDPKDKDRQSRIFNEVNYIDLKLSSSSKNESFVKLMRELQECALEEKYTEFEIKYEEYMKMSRAIVLGAWGDIQSDLR